MQKKSLIESLSAAVLPALAFGSLLASCNPRNPELPAPNCSIPATVRSFTTPDSCRDFVLDLASSDLRLRPTGPLWQAFRPRNGQRVFIEYVATTDSSGLGCRAQVGKLVRITCIHADTVQRPQLPGGPHDTTRVPRDTIRGPRDTTKVPHDTIRTK